jgi:hypothetical protein
MEPITHTFNIKCNPMHLQKVPTIFNFVTKIKNSKKNFSEGKYRTIKVDDLWK